MGNGKWEMKNGKLGNGISKIRNRKWEMGNLEMGNE
jgi:hypothetical protein